MTINKSPEIRREEIFNSALICFNQKGYFKTSIDDIAAEAGISKGGVYHHFSSKKELFIELFHYRVNSYFDRATAHVSEKNDAADRIRSLVERSQEIFQENAYILKFCLEFVMMGTRDADIRREVTRLYQSRVKTFSRMLKSGVDSGTFRNIDSEGVARALYCLSMGFFLNYFTVNIDFDPLDQHAVNMQTFFEGIKKI